MVISCRGRELTHLEKAAEDIRALGTKCLGIPSHVAKIEDSKNLVEKVKAYVRTWDEIHPDTRAWLERKSDW